MEKRNNNLKLWVAAGFLGFGMLLTGTQAMAQTEKPETKKVRVKIFENINGKTTTRDTLMEIAAVGGQPDFSEIRKNLTQFSPAESEDHKQLLKELKEKGRTVEIKRLEEVFKDGEMPENIRVRISQPVPRVDFAVPDTLRKFLRIERQEIEKIRNLETFKIDRKALENLTDKNEFKMVNLFGDSVFVVNRLIIISHDLTEPEKALLDNKAKEKTASAKIKDLELEAVNLYPNPNNGMFKVSFKAPKKGKTTVVVMDNLGKELFREELGNFSGNYEKELNLEGKAKGVYFLQVIQGKQVFNKKVLVQ